MKIEMKYKGIKLKEFESEKPVLFDTPKNGRGSPMSKTDEFYRLAALRAAEGFTAKKPVMTRYQLYYASHKEQVKLKAKAYRESHKEQEREWYRKWKKETAKLQGVA